MSIARWVKITFESAVSTLFTSMTHAFRRATAGLLIAVTMAGCSTSVEIPLHQIGEPTWREPGKYRLRLTDSREYYVRRFSVADSNLVVDERLKMDDALYGDTNPPSSLIPVDQVRSVEKIESNKKSLLIFGGVVAAMVTFFVIQMFEGDEVY